VEGCKLRHFGHGIQQNKIRPLSQVEDKEGQFTSVKNDHMTPKNIFLKNTNMGIKKRRILC
jgi:hypothetical protein